MKQDEEKEKDGLHSESEDNPFNAWNMFWAIPLLATCLGFWIILLYWISTLVFD